MLLLKLGGFCLMMSAISGVFVGHPKYRKPYEYTAPKVVYIRPRDALGRYVAYKNVTSVTPALPEQSVCI